MSARWCVFGQALLFYDSGSCINAIGAAVKRLDPADNFDPLWVEDFKCFVVRELSGLDAFPPNTEFSFTDWVERGRYNQARQFQIIEAREKWLDQGKPLNKLLKLEDFIKHEGYMEAKFPRLINPHGDVTKGEFGPQIHQLEEVVYAWFNRPGSNAGFVKGLNNWDRVKRLLSRWVNGMYVLVTDHSTFEGRQVTSMIDACEVTLVRKMFKNFPDFVSEYENVLLHKKSVLSFARGAMKFIVRTCRMSGEVSTSLGNGLLNILSFKYVCARQHIMIFDMVAEGDDGLALTSGVPDIGMFHKLNLDVKLQVHLDLSGASFCNLSMTASGDIVVDPIKYLIKLGWITGSKRMSIKMRDPLLLAKAMSYLVMAPRTPVLHEVCSFIINSLDVVPVWDEIPYLLRDVDIISLVPLSLSMCPTTESVQLVCNLFNYDPSLLASLATQLCGFGYHELPSTQFLESIWDNYVVDFKQNIIYSDDVSRMPSCVSIAH